MQYDAEIMLAFIEEIAEYIPQLRQHLNTLAKNPRKKESLEEAHRLAHTIKGSAAMLELDAISAEGKLIEQTLEPSADSNSKKKAPFDPNSVGRLMAAVDKVEYLLNKVKTELEGGAQPEPPVMVAPVEPPRTQPPVVVAPVEPPRAQPPVAPPPKMPEPSKPATPGFAPPPPPPGWFNAGMVEPAAPLAPPPVPPAPKSSFSIFDEDDDLADFQLNPTPPPPAPPPVNFQPAKTVTPPTPSVPVSQRPMSPGDLFADFDLFGADTPGEPNPLPPVQPKPVTPPVAPVQKEIPPVVEPDFDSFSPETDLMDLLFEPDGLESLEEALFPNEATYAPRNNELKDTNTPATPPDNRLKLDTATFDRATGATNPLKDLQPQTPSPHVPAVSGHGSQPPQNLRTPFDDFDLDLIGLDLGELDDILATSKVDQNIAELQNEILSELPPQMADFDSVPLPGEIGVTDADLLQALGQDTTSTDLAGFHQGNALAQPINSPEPLPKFDDFLPTLPPLPEIENEAAPLHDFTAAADLLAQFEPEPIISPTIADDATTFVPGQIVKPTEKPAATPGFLSAEQAFAREGLAETFAAGQADEDLAHKAALDLRATPPQPGFEQFNFNFPADMTEEEALAAFEALDQVSTDAAEVVEEEEYSSTELAEAGLVSGDDQLGAFFLAEAQSDIDKLKKLVAEYDPASQTEANEARKIGEISQTLRKAADMMGLDDVARQAGVLENTANLVVDGELRHNEQSVNLFQHGLQGFLALLAPYKAAAASLFAAPAEPAKTINIPEPVKTVAEKAAPSSSFEKALAEEEAIAAAAAAFAAGSDEDFDLEAAVAQMQAETTTNAAENEYSAAELAEAGLVSGDDQLGAFFLAEAQSDVDKLKELVADFDAPDSDRQYDAKKIGEISQTLRKAADMMGLVEISEQAGTLEGLAQQVEVGEFAEAGNVFQPELANLLLLLAPYEAAAASLFAPPPATSVPDEEETDDEQELEPAVAAPLPVADIRPKITTAPLTPATDIDPELAEVFAAEAEEHIQILDSKLAGLENDPNNRELLREIRRSAHTLKGSAAMLNFQVISQTAHLMEDLLDRLYDGTAQVTPEVVELLFLTFNGMDSMVRGLSQGVPEDPQILEDLRPRYAAILTGEAEDTEQGGAVIFKPRPVAPPLAAAIRPRAPQAVSTHQINEAEVEALEAALAAADVEPTDEAEAPSVLLPRIAPTAPARPVATQSSSGDAEQLAVKIPIKRLDTMMNQIGELVINRTVLERRNQILSRTVDELTLSIKRMQRVTRELETRYEVELLKNSAMPIVTTSGSDIIPPANGGGTPANGGTPTNGSSGLVATVAMPAATRPEFDTLEMDQYTEFHTLSREMAETVDDLAAALRELGNLKSDLDNAVLQQARLTDDLQDRVVKVRLVPVSNLTPRLYRTVRSVASLQGKDVQFVVSGEQTQLDKTIFEELGDPLLHLVRNAIDHGIEMPDDREASGKPRQATLTFAARSEGSQVVIEVREDGRGINLDKIKKRGVERGLLAPNSSPTDDELLDLLFIPGFSTADAITDISGRGVGLDVVRANIARLKGTVEVTTELGHGTTFSIRLPSTLAITRALLVKVAGYTYAIPLNSIERTLRPDQKSIEEYSQRAYYRLEDATLPLLELGQLLQLQPHQRRIVDDEEEEGARSRFALKRERPLLLINGPERAVLRVDSMLGQQEVVVKPLGTHLKFVPGVTGATILGTGEVILILNAYELVSGALGRRRYSNLARGHVAPQPQPRQHSTSELPPLAETRRKVPVIQVVDDSLSVRKVLSTALEKAGFRVRTSKDGQEALEMVQQNSPDLIIMDIEMPRMDGYELTSILKSRESFRNIPIVMLTSRAGLKHRQKAEEVGADGFLIKPYREHELLQIVSELLTR